MTEKSTKDNPLVTLRRSAMDILARREHSFHELIAKLERKHPDFDTDEQILPVLNTLSEENLQSDQRFVESYIRYRCNLGFGPLKIQAELYQKGVAASLIKPELYADNYHWLEHCQAALDKRFPLREDSSIKERQRYQRFLSQRGYSEENIRKSMYNK